MSTPTFSTNHLQAFLGVPFCNVATCTLGSTLGPYLFEITVLWIFTEHEVAFMMFAGQGRELARK